MSLTASKILRHSIHLPSPMGILCLEDDGEAITNLYFDDPPAGSDRSSALLERGRAELAEYFDGHRKAFDLPLHPTGTAFQRKVWEALCRIPYGATCSYEEVAVAVGNPKACRAVGGANHKNPIMILIPCHRVIGKSGDLVGFGGGLDRKAALLAIEHPVE